MSTHVTPNPDGANAALKAAAAELYEDAGLPMPIILERPEPDITGAFISGLHFSVHGNTIEVTRYKQASETRELCTPGAIRDFAAGVAAMADMAEAEPDPAEVEELADLMLAEMDRRGSGQCGLYPAVARIALRWMREREGTP